MPKSRSVFVRTFRYCLIPKYSEKQSRSGFVLANSTSPILRRSEVQPFYIVRRSFDDGLKRVNSEVRGLIAIDLAHPLLRFVELVR